MGPHEIAWFEAALQAVAPTGLPERTMIDVVLLLNAYVRGAQGPVGQAQAERRSGWAWSVGGNERPGSRTRAGLRRPQAGRKRWPHT